MRQALLALGSIVLIVSCAHTPSQSAGTPGTTSRSSEDVSAAAAGTLLSLSQQWADSWNQRDIERMAGLHGDVTRTFYVIGETSTPVQWLLREIREKNFWDLSWNIHMVEPHVRLLGADAGLVSFRLVGDELSARGTKPFNAAFTLVYQKLDGEWKIVHVQDSSRLEAPAQ